MGTVPKAPDSGRAVNAHLGSGSALGGCPSARNGHMCVGGATARRLTPLRDLARTSAFERFFAKICEV